MLIERPPHAGDSDAPGVDAEAGQAAESSDALWASITQELRARLTQAVNALLRAVLKRSENPGYAEDIVNEALTAAYQKRASYDASRGPLYPWLLRIAKNRAFDFLRRNSELKSERSFDEDLDGAER